MKKSITVFSFIMLLAAIIYSNPSQGRRTKYHTSIATKDSMFLTKDNSFKIYSLNIEIGQGLERLIKVGSSSEIIKTYVEKGQQRRDSLYQTILQEDKYRLYKQESLKIIGSDGNIISNGS